jgi:hypothetical protein
MNQIFRWEKLNDTQLGCLHRNIRRLSKVASVCTTTLVHSSLRPAYQPHAAKRPRYRFSTPILSSTRREHQSRYLKHGRVRPSAAINNRSISNICKHLAPKKPRYEPLRSCNKPVQLFHTRTRMCPRAPWADQATVSEWAAIRK